MPLCFIMQKLYYHRKKQFLFVHMLCNMAEYSCLKNLKSLIPLSLKVAALWFLFYVSNISCIGSDQISLPLGEKFCSGGVFFKGCTKVRKVR
jgi:hypothetical protein